MSLRVQLDNVLAVAEGVSKMAVERLETGIVYNPLNYYQINMIIGKIWEIEQIHKCWIKFLSFSFRSPQIYFQLYPVAAPG